MEKDMNQAHRSRKLSPHELGTISAGGDCVAVQTEVRDCASGSGQCTWVLWQCPGQEPFWEEQA